MKMKKTIAAVMAAMTAVSAMAGVVSAETREEINLHYDLRTKVTTVKDAFVTITETYDLSNARLWYAHPSVDSTIDREGLHIVGGVRDCDARPGNIRERACCERGIRHRERLAVRERVGDRDRGIRKPGHGVRSIVAERCGGERRVRHRERLAVRDGAADAERLLL